jgi:hypothetical protein
LGPKHIGWARFGWARNISVGPVSVGRNMSNHSSLEATSDSGTTALRGAGPSQCTCALPTVGDGGPVDGHRLPRAGADSGAAPDARRGIGPGVWTDGRASTHGAWSYRGLARSRKYRGLAREAVQRCVALLGKVRVTRKGPCDSERSV